MTVDDRPTIDLTASQRATLAGVRSCLVEGALITITDGERQTLVHAPLSYQSNPRSQSAEHSDVRQVLLSVERAQALGLSDATGQGAVAYRSEAPLHPCIVEALSDPLSIKLPDTSDSNAPGEQGGALSLVRAVPPSFADGLIELCKDSGRLPVLFVLAPGEFSGTAATSIAAETFVAFADRRRNSARTTQVSRTASAPLATHANAHGELNRYIDFNDPGREHLAMVYGEIDARAPVLVRVHSKCATGDLFGSRRCDCGEQLAEARQRLGADNGVLLYLDQEGRGIGLDNKLHAYRLQDQGLDTFEANHQLGFEDDRRNFTLAAEILRDLGISQVRLLSNNPEKVGGLEHAGVKVIERLALIAPQDQARDAYLAAKKRAGHLL